MVNAGVVNGRASQFPPPSFCKSSRIFSQRRFNSGMQQAGINGMAEREVDKAGGVKG